MSLKKLWPAACLFGLLVACQPAGSPVSTGPSGLFVSPSAEIPSASPPAAPGAARRTDNPLDLAIAGPAYFLLALRADPRGFADLRLTRRAALRWTRVPALSAQPASAGPERPYWRLENEDGLIVLGISLDGADPALPAESRATTWPEALTLGGAGSLRVMAAPLRLDALANPNAPIDLSFDARGRVAVAGQAPVDADSRPLTLAVALALPEQPNRLERQAGSPYLRYDAGAGALAVGLAGEPAASGAVARPIGDANLILPGRLDGEAF